MSGLDKPMPVHRRGVVLSPGWVYFIQEGKRGLVKVGWATDPVTRLSIIQAGNSRRLHMRKTIPSISQSYEYDLHQFYKEHRVVREWFRPVVLEIEPPPPAEGHPVRGKPELPPRICGNCRAPWDDHDDARCPEGWMPPEVKQWIWERRFGSPLGPARVTGPAA